MPNVVSLSATVGNLQAKVETLTTTNALMKEDLAIAKNNLLALYDENRHLRQECGKDMGSYSMSASGVQITNISDSDSGSKVVGGEVDELKQRLDEERKLRQEADNELELQVRPLLFFKSISLRLHILIDVPQS